MLGGLEIPEQSEAPESIAIEEQLVSEFLVQIFEDVKVKSKLGGFEMAEPLDALD
jgi:hypothetical protein